MINVKTQEMKCDFIWILAVLMLIGFLGLASISLAVEDTWTQKADMPTARKDLSTSMVNGKIYAIGGSPGKAGSLSTVEEYDPATDTWTTKADMPTARWGFSTSVVNGKIYAIGGSPGEPADAGVFSTVEEYDPATDIWTAKAHMPKARYGLSTSVVDGKIYAFGGARTCGTPAFSTLEEYDPATDAWTAKADMPKARQYFSTSAVDGKIYAIGGAGQATWTPFSTVEEYNPATDTWTTKADMPKGKLSFSTSAVDGKIYAIGGSFIAYPWAPVPTVEEYDTGFVPLITSVDVMGTITSVDVPGKLTTTWGKIK
jgi:N-acetylneuraminic acid mutarotase